MATQYSITAGGGMQSSSIDHSRRMYNFGEKVSELAPKQSPFFSYLSKVAKKPTDDPVFKFLEQRHQWQRRNFEVKTAMTTSAHSGSDANFNLTNLQVDCLYDKYGRVVTTATLPNFILEGQMVVIECEYDANGTDAGVGSETAAKAYYKINATPDVSNSTYAEIDGTFIKVVYKPTGSVSGEIAEASASKLIFRADGKGQIVGSAFAEGSTDPEGWKDEFYDREGYCQIFKTAISLFSGTSLATRYRGVSNEYKRVWQEKLMEHKMDLEHAMLFGVGSDDSTSTGPVRRSWGIVPYTEAYGKIKTFTYASSSYDDFIDAMEDVFSPESGNSGNKLVLASRKVLSYFNKLGGSSFLGNTMALGHTLSGSDGASNGYSVDIQNVKGSFGHNVTRVNTLYGDLHLVEQPLFRGMWEDYAVMVDLKNVAYRPLAANGTSRDTHIITNVQNNNVDGRKDQILTEAGLEISLPETHTLLKFA
jgi:hypothetical protein